MRTLFRGGSVFDGSRHLGSGELLVEDGRVVEVGRSLARSGGAETVDLAGGLVAPGFVDAHVHVVQGGLERLRCDLSEGSTREDYLQTVAGYVRDHPEVEWVLGGGWSMTAFPGGTPAARDLDAVVADRPAFLPNRDHHGAWVNTRALELAGIDRTSPDPPHGRIERDADGRPTGTLHEAAMDLVTRLVPPTTLDDQVAGLLEGQRYLHSLGVTGWQEAIVGEYAGAADCGPTYRQAADDGRLVSTVVGALWWDRDRGLEQVPDLLARREHLSGGRFRATSVKLMQDGVVESRTAALTTPYLGTDGRPTAEAGHSFVDPPLLREAAHRLAAEGFQLHIHAIGDRAVREALDALAGARPQRHHVAHVQLVHPDDVPRFATLGVAANIQALWACLDDQMVDLTLPVLGPERAGWQYPFGDLHRAGAALVAGSDWPVSTPDPLAAIHTAVNRTSYGDPGRAGSEPLLPSQRLPLEVAMAAYTSASARVCSRDLSDGAGRLRPGAVADLVVLDRDPFRLRPEEIGAARVASTWLGGEAAFRR